MTDLQAMLADAVRTASKNLGITQKELAEQAGCSQKHLSRMLGGYAGGTFELWESLLNILGIRVSWTHRKPKSRA